MTSTARKLLEEALKLDERERTELAAELLGSVDPVLRAVASAPVVDLTDVERVALDAAQRDSSELSHDDMVDDLSAHFGVAPEEWRKAHDADE